MGSSKYLKILHVLYDDTGNPWCGGGGSVRARKINEYIASKGHKVTVITGNYLGAENSNVNGVTYRHLGFKWHYGASRLSFVLMSLIEVLKFRGDLIINDISVFAPCFANAVSRIPSITIMHHIMADHAFKMYGIWGAIPRYIEKLLVKISSTIITPSEHLKQRLLRLTSHKRISSIPNGVDERYFSLVPEEDNNILFLGRLDLYMKGLDVLVHAFSLMKNRDVTLVIAGRGKEADRKEIHSLIRQYAIDDRVVMAGRVSESEKERLMQRCLFFVQPSRFEGWGMAAVEANACGKAVVGTNISGLNEAVCKDRTAILVKKEDVHELKSACEALISDGLLRKKLGNSGRIWASKFAWNAIAESQLQLYIQTIGFK